MQFKSFKQLLDVMQENVYILDIPKVRSSLISRLEYDEDKGMLAVTLRYAPNPVIYEGVKWLCFKDACEAESIGRFYLNNIKPNFKQVKNYQMAERPKTKNKASDEVRWIDISINVREIKKEWIVPGEKGDYLNIKLRMLPDGQIDKYGSLGMIVQTVPSSVYKAAEAEKKGSGKDISGPILGNAAELDWGNRGTEGMPGVTDQPLPTEPIEDLPF